MDAVGTEIMIDRVRGYEVRCSQYLAICLGAWLGNYQGRDRLHWDSGYLWWVSNGEL